MERNIVFIVNPIAGNEKWKHIAPYIEKKYPNAFVLCTEQAGQAVEIARYFANTNSIIYAVGGDGTLNEVLNGMMMGECNSILSTIPCGSGRDFARNFAKIGDPRKFLEAELEVSPMDVGMINDRYFINAVAIGITSEIGDRANKVSAKIPSTLKYLIKIPGAIYDYEFPSVKREVESELIEQNITTIMISNGGYIGGGFNPAPYAKLDDGLLDVCVVGDMSKFRIPGIALDLKRGKHLLKKGVIPFLTDNIYIESPDDMNVNVDGENLKLNKFKCIIKKKAINFGIPKI